LRLGIVADAHLGPAGTTVPAFHVEYGNTDTLTTYQLALRRCVREGVDGLLLLGDLSHSGDEESLEAGVRTAAETELAVWIVSGNHDCFSREDALADAVRRVGAENVRLLTPDGEAVAESLRLAGFSVRSGSWGYAAGPTGRPDVSGWGDDECVVWVTHYPAVSFSEEVSAAGLVYGDDLEDLEEVTRPLLRREAPAVVVNGHVARAGHSYRGAGAAALVCGAHRASVGGHLPRRQDRGRPGRGPQRERATRTVAHRAPSALLAPGTGVGLRGGCLAFPGAAGSVGGGFPVTNALGS
jgi:hypothetical protein